MKRNKVIILSVIAATILSGCSAKTNITEIEPLAKNQKVQPVIIKAGLVDSLGPAKYFENIKGSNSERSFHPELDFFEVVVSYGVHADPKNILLMLNYYVASNQQKEGIEFFERILKRYDKQLDKHTRTNILAVYSVLRATHANDVPLYKRIPWVLDTFEMLEDAEKSSQGKNPIVHWCAGLIYAQMPFFFFKHGDAVKELTWLVQHPETEPIPGFYREVYHYLAKLYKDEGKDALARKYLMKSAYDEYEPKSLFMDWMSSSKTTGLAFAPKPWMKEVIENRLYSMHGFGFSDIYFLISEDRSELIAIDAGTQPFATKKAYELFKKSNPNSPLLTTLIVTHAHWDHVGGHTAFLALNPNLKIIGSAHFHDVLKRATREPRYKHFRTESYKNEWLENYKPTVKISKAESITIGGTNIDLIPVKGNETEDALFVHLAKENTTFVGDVMMPYLGDPWIEEGFIEEASEAMETIIDLNPQHILHGHYGLTEMYGKTKHVKVFNDSYKWLVKNVRKHVESGYSADDILRLNLIPPGLEKYPESFTGYIAQRNYVIARIVDKSTGYWHEDKTAKEPRGFFSLTSVEYGRLLKTYLNLSEAEVVTVLRKMIKNGDLELALYLSTAAQNRYKNSEAITDLREEAADRLRSISQFFDPMKFAVYAEMINKEHKMMPDILVNDTNK